MAEIADQVTTALDPIAESLAADGYRLEVADDGGSVVTIAVAATDEACEDCLVPKTVFQPMLETLLEQQGLEGIGIDLRYPVDG